MEVDQLQIQSDLLALRQLYSLLQNLIGFGIPNINLESVGKLLDKKAVQLLKKLLDDARERLSKSTHSQINSRARPGNCSTRFGPSLAGNYDLSTCSLIVEEKLSVEEETEISNGIADAIFEIDSRIRAMQLVMMNPVKALGKKTCYEMRSQQVSRARFQYLDKPKAVGRNDEYSSKQVLKNNHALSRLNESPIPNETAAVERTESMSRGMSYVHGFRVPDLSYDEENSGTRPPLRVVRSNPTAKKASNGARKITRCVPLMKPTDDHHRRIMRPTLLMDQEDHDQRRNRVSSDTDYSSIESERYPTTSSSSSSPISYSSSGTEGEEINDQSLSSSSYSPSPIRNSNKTYFSRRERDSEKGIGRLRRIKNKLGLIFHHHHHHHHHHHEYHRSSNWKLLQRIFHSKNKAGKNYNNKQNGTRKSVVKSGHNVKRGGNIDHFHALVEGLMQHVGGRRRGLKKPKTGKGGRNNIRLGKGVGLWRRFGRRGGMKMVNRRGRVRAVRFANKTPKLEM